MILPLFCNVDSQDFSRLEAVLGHSQGYNQAALPSMMSATNDCEAVKTFLADYRNTPLTYRSYLKEVERLVLWCLEVPKVTISDLKREHLTQYREFLSDPVPTKLWCGPRKPRMTEDGEVNPDWRPFVSGLSGPTIRKTMSILDSFFNYLVQNNYFAGNPLAVDKRRRGEKSRSTERWLERDEIVTTLQALDDYLIQYPNRTFEIVRAKYIILTLFYTGLRLAEITHHKMGDFVLIEGDWYLKVIGKGEKERKIVVVDEYLDILVNFRTLVGFKTKLPSYDEPIPLVPAQNMSPLTENRIWQILKWSFELGARKYEAMTTTDEETALKHQHKASKLRKASTHWLRHSYGTYLVKSGVSIEKVKELMGHSDISTTMIYVHIAKNDLHAQARGLSLAESSTIEDKI